MRIFVRVPSNTVSGGIKVANQLVNLFRENGLASFLVVNGEPRIAQWMINPAPVISFDALMAACERDDIVIDNWIDYYTIETTKKLAAKTKIYYSQGSTFFKNQDLIGDDHLVNGNIYSSYWAVSSDAQKILEASYPKTGKWHLVSPYFHQEIITSIRSRCKNREHAILCLSRKGRNQILFTKLLLGRRIRFDIIDRPFTEIEIYHLLSSHKFFLSTATGISHQYMKNVVRILTPGSAGFLKVINPYREGFPLPPAEAAMCGSIVIGFAMGGGMEWMSADNCFLARDRSYWSLMAKCREALAAPEEQLMQMSQNAFAAVNRFNKENTWRQITVFFNEHRIEL